MASSSAHDVQSIGTDPIANKHGSGAGQDPGEASPGAPLNSEKKRRVDDGGAGDTAEQSLELSSDESLNAVGATMQTLVARPASTPRTSPPPGRRGGALKSKPGAATRGRGGLRVARNLSRGPGGVPSAQTMAEVRDREKPIVREHVLAPSGRAYGESDVEVRLKSLEMQRDLDHKFFNDMAEHIKTVVQAQEFQQSKIQDHDKGLMEFAKLNIDMRHSYAALREENDQRFKGLDVSIPQIITASLDDRVAKVLYGMMEKTEAAFDTLRGQLAEAFGSLSEIRGQRPRDGEIIQGAFQQAHRDLEQVKDFVRASVHAGTTSTAPPADPNAVTFTQTMFSQIKDNIQKVHELEKLAGVVDLMNTRTAVIGKNSEELVGTVIAYGERIRVLETSAANPPQKIAEHLGGHGGPGASGPAGSYTDLRCSTCGPLGDGFGAPGCGGVPPPAPGLAGGGDPLGLMKEIIGGNGRCHCKHVESLIARVNLIEQAGGGRGAHGPRPGGDGHGSNDDPLQTNDAWRRPRDDDPVPRDARGRRTLPLHLPEPLGAAGYKEKALFDEKLTTQAEYRYDGNKDGAAWKGKVERHFISRAPVLKNLLAWAEEEELETISVEKFRQAVGSKLNEEQCMIVNAAIWGFLSAAVSGTAETLFEGAKTLNGLDAWRRLVRSIEKGKAVRLEQLRREVKLLYLRKIPSMDRIEEGIASFENKIREYTSLGGTAQSNEEMKQDLLNILPGELSSQLLWRASDDGPYSAFRDHILNMTNKILMNDKVSKGRIGAVSTERPEPSNDDIIDEQEEPFNISGVSNFEDFVMAVNRFNNKRKAGQRAAPQQVARGPNAASPAGDRGPRRCPNCNGTHPERKCPKPAVAVSDRRCWVCNKKGHVGRDCPDKTKGVKAIEDVKGANVLNWIGSVDDEGFQQPRRTVRRPTPRPATLGDFLSENVFSALNVLEEIGDQGHGASGPTGERPGAGRPASQKAAVPVDRPAKTEGKDPVCPRSSRCPTGRRRQEGRSDDDVDPSGSRARSRVPADDGSVAEPPGNIQTKNSPLSLGMLEEESGDLLAAMTQRVKIKAAIDSGAVANVIHPRELPDDAEPEPNEAGTHFSGAGGGRITKYGFCKTVLEQNGERVGCNWSLADVTRPLHAVSQVTGPVDEPGRQDVLFTNKRCVIVPPGVVDKIMREYNIKPVLEYQREGNLYLAEMEMSSFRRQGMDA